MSGAGLPLLFCGHFDRTPLYQRRDCLSPDQPPAADLDRFQFPALHKAIDCGPAYPERAACFPDRNVNPLHPVAPCCGRNQGVRLPPFRRGNLPVHQRGISRSTAAGVRPILDAIGSVGHEFESGRVTRTSGAHPKEVRAQETAPPPLTELRLAPLP